MAWLFFIFRVVAAVASAWAIAPFLPSGGYPHELAMVCWAVAFFCMLDLGALPHATLHPAVLKLVRLAGASVVAVGLAAVASAYFSGADGFGARLNSAGMTWAFAAGSWILLRLTRTTSPAILEGAAAVAAAVAAYGPADARVAMAKNALALAFRHEGRIVKAGELLDEALVILAEPGVDDGVNLATVLANKAAVACLQKKYSTAERLYLRALSVKEKLFGADSPRLAMTLSGLGTLYYRWGYYSKAQTQLRRAMALAARDENLAGCSVMDIGRDLEAVCRTAQQEQEQAAAK